VPDHRSDTASRLIKATAARVYHALTDKAQFALWIAPEGAHASIDHFDPRPGGSLQITLTFDRPGGGKTTANTDTVKGRFLEIHKDVRVRIRRPRSGRHHDDDMGADAGGGWYRSGGRGRERAGGDFERRSSSRHGIVAREPSSARGGRYGRLNWLGRPSRRPASPDFRGRLKPEPMWI
jgi:hypothetical protein